MEARAGKIILLLLLVTACQKERDTQADAIAQTAVTPTIAITKPTNSRPRNLKIKVGLDSPGDLKVTTGTNVKAGQIISDRPSTKQQLINQRQTLSIQIQQLQQQQRYQIVARESELEPLKLEVQTAWINLKQFRNNRRYTKTTYRQLPTVASSESTQGTQLEQAYLSAKSRLKQAKSNFKAAKAADDNQLRSLSSQIAVIDRQILQTGVTRSPYSGKVKKIKFLGQNNGELLAEIVISTETRKSQKAIATEHLSPSNSSDTQVISVHDGDTIRTQKYRIRLACIDAPELKQPLGYKSRDNLLKLISQAGDRIQLQIVDTDRHGRKVALIYANGKLLNLQQVTDGMGYAYKKYLDSCPQAEAIKQAETIAQQQRRGVWAGNYQPPWEFRKRQASN
jgi:micrococcal nuclease